MIFSGGDEIECHTTIKKVKKNSCFHNLFHYYPQIDFDH